MMNQKDLEIWERLVQSYTDYMFASRDFLSDDVDRVSIIKQILTPKNPAAASGEGLENRVSSGDDLITAFRVLGWLSSDELKQIFDLLISRASTAHGGILAIRQAIRLIPKEWLLANIEAAVEPYLQTGDDEAYWRFLELYYEIDPELTRRLALRALEQDDYDIREAGQDFLDKLSRKEDTTGSA